MSAASKPSGRSVPSTKRRGCGLLGNGSSLRKMLSPSTRSAAANSKPTLAPRGSFAGTPPSRPKRAPLWRKPELEKNWVVRLTRLTRQLRIGDGSTLSEVVKIAFAEGFKRIERLLPCHRKLGNAT